jgi:ubiquinone/menaquinone biosynthesis C-methylase UbiE
MSINEEKLNTLLGKMVVEIGAAVTGPLVLIGDKLGLYRTLAEKGPMDAHALSGATNTNERYIREWLSAQAASGYIDYDAEARTFSMSPEQAAVFADQESPFLMTGGYYSLASTYHDEPKLVEAFKTGDGIAWDAHNGCLFCGVAKFFRPGYRAHLVQEWLPSLNGVDERLKKGGKVADVGCGYGISTVLMAKHYPNSTFVGYDIHEGSIREARALAKKENVPNVTFEVSTAKAYPGRDYDLVTFFDCLHDMGDPAGAAEHVYESLREGGSWMIVEPFAHDELEHNLNSVGRVYYAFSTLVCTPTSLSQEVGAAIGAQAGEKRIREMIEPAGFASIRRAAETPFNVILEARKQESLRAIA